MIITDMANEMGFIYQRKRLQVLITKNRVPLGVQKIPHRGGI